VSIGLLWKISPTKEVLRQTDESKFTLSLREYNVKCLKFEVPKVPKMFMAIV